MPWLCITYLVMRVDLNNVGNAAILNLEQGHGIKQQLHLDPQQWNWVVSCFFYTYAFLEPVSTILMKKTTYVPISFLEFPLSSLQGRAFGSGV